MSRLVKLCSAVALIAWVPRVAAADVTVPRWRTQDFSFESTTAHPNPFEVDFSAEVTGPGGLRFRQLGFYDGQGVWKIRLGPNAPGQWSIRTVSSDPQLDGRTVSDIRCIAQENPRIRGGLLVDPDHPHHFVREDGSRFFYSGYECDWLWAIDLASPEPGLPRTTRLLDKLVAHRFNLVIMNVYAHNGFGDQKPDFGPPALFAWGGTNDRPNHAVFNVPFWRHYDDVIRAMWERGLEAHVMIKVYNKHVNWPKPASPQDDLYFKYVIARYAPFCNVHWDFSKESNNEKDLDYKLGRMALIRRIDPYRRLLTTHTDHEHYPRYRGILDYRTDQNHQDFHATVLRQRAAENWPIVNSEYGYECGPGGTADRTYQGGAQDASTVLDRALQVYMGGGYGAYYYTYTAWDVIRVDDTPPGYAYFRNLAGFFERTGYWLMEPSDDRVDEGYCLARPGLEYIAYQPRGQAFTLEVSNAASALAAEWFDPVGGRSASAGEIRNGANRLVPPSGWAGPILLHAGKAPAAPAVLRSTFDRPLPGPGK